MKTEEKRYRSLQGFNDQLVSQAVIIEGLNYRSLETAINNFKKNYSINECENIVINYYICQNILTKEDMFNKRF